jgi:hypothetical protein
MSDDRLLDLAVDGSESIAQDRRSALKRLPLRTVVARRALDAATARKAISNFLLLSPRKLTAKWPYLFSSDQLDDT